ncbi:putative argininosuccinate synthetase [Operophtera brumata]|uniref:argininosuccinate synthase n=1 Tax=Operophtera brumata TaxID=104452 RepID=A0A0L7LBC1_OPEBR|nr:putative argininosuccinate synthetase [Operophtera brumata]
MMGKDLVILAYSGGLDTSCILKWLIQKNYDVVCFMADVGQNEDFSKAKQKAIDIGAKDEFVSNYMLPAIQMGLVYEGRYYLGTSLARPCISVALIIAPWRLPEFFDRFQGRTDLIEYAKKENIPVSATPKEPWSTDENIMHISLVVFMKLQRGPSCIKLTVKKYLQDKMADFVYNGFWFSPEANFTRKCLQLSQESITGSVTVQVFKGNEDSTGFININALRLKEYARFDAQTK